MAQISLRVDDDVKRGVEQDLNDFGLSMSTAGQDGIIYIVSCQGHYD